MLPPGRARGGDNYCKRPLSGNRCHAGPEVRGSSPGAATESSDKGSLNDDPLLLFIWKKANVLAMMRGNLFRKDKTCKIWANCLRSWRPARELFRTELRIVVWDLDLKWNLNSLIKVFILHCSLLWRITTFIQINNLINEEAQWKLNNDYLLILHSVNSL